MSEPTESAANDKRPSRTERFVQDIMTRCKQDRGLAARLRRADNPDTEYQSWEVLVQFGVKLDWDDHRLPHALVSAAIAKSKNDQDGEVGLGRTLAGCYGDGNNSDQAKAKLRRLLACDSVAEACRVLRPMLSLINSKNSRQLNHVVLLDQLLNFRFQPQRIKARWAQDFYSRSEREVQAGGDE